MVSLTIEASERDKSRSEMREGGGGGEETINRK